MESPYLIHDQWKKREEEPSGVEAELVEKGGFDNLKEWMESRKNRYSSEVDFGLSTSKYDFRGRLYPTNSGSILYNSDKEGIVQGASSPSYFGGLWSLACCKKDMRRSNNFKDSFREIDTGHYKPEKPVFVFTVSSKQGDKYQGDSKQWLASVAMVTDGFLDMEKYGNYLLDNYSGETVENRITVRPDDSDHIGAKKGDCHVDFDGQRGKPSSQHDHVEDSPPCGEEDDNGYKDDLDSSHMKVVSQPNFWISWRHPMFTTKNKTRGVKLRSYENDIDGEGVGRGIEDRLEEVNSD